MDKVPQRLTRWWSGLDGHGRRHATVLFLIGLGYVGHYLVYCIPQPFYIEDAGISFTFAENLVRGEGLVAYPGGERVEGYSNALWTFLLALFYGLGLPTWTSSKLLGAALGVATLPLAYDLVRRARPGARDDVALLAPLMLAASPQFAIWNASGLENSLFCLLLALGAWTLVVELETPPERWRWPWSGLVFFLLSMTRPEGIMYGMVALLAVVLHLLALGPRSLAPGKLWREPALRRRLAYLGLWLAFFGLPFLLYNGWRYWYFAWPYPNTYYGKLETKATTNYFNWRGGGWKYTHNYLLMHQLVWFLPLAGVATVGVGRRWRTALLVVSVALLTLVIAWDGRTDLVDLPAWWRKVQREWNEIRVWGIAGFATLWGLAALGRRGWRTRGLLWGFTVAAVFFVVYSRGDWMKAHRWFNIVAVPLFGVLVVGLGDLLDALPLDRFQVGLPRVLTQRLGAWSQRALGLRTALLLLPAGLWVASESWHAREFALDPETAVRDVHRRVKYMQWVQKRLDVDHITLMDVDMGAHMYLSGWDILDFAGLVDVPVARHRDFNKKFMKEYVFEERKPEFAHVHGNWAKSSKIPTHPEWDEQYFEISGYPIGGRKLHIGNNIRKDLFITESRRSSTPGARFFDGGVRLVDFDLPSPEVAPGGQLYVDSTWAAGFRKDGFRIVVFLDDGAGHRATAAFPPGYDWYPPEVWKVRERVAGRYRMDIPEDLPLGTYRVGLVLLDEATGEVLALQDGEPQAAEEDPPEAEGASDDTGLAEPPSEAPAHEVAVASDAVYLPGEWTSDLQVLVVSPEDALAAAQADLQRALEMSANDRCDGAWKAFKDATRHVMRREGWREDHEPEVRRAIAGCYAARAQAAVDRDKQVDALVQARFYDHRHEDMLAQARPLAAQLDLEGDAAFAAQNWQAAYDAYATAMKLDPTRSWTRRKAEEARDKRLGITPPWK